MAKEVKNPPPLNWLDKVLRRFYKAAYFGAIGVLYGIAVTAIGLALAPALALGAWLVPYIERLHWALRFPAWGMLLGAGFFIFGFALLIIVPIYNKILPTKLLRFKGGYFTLSAVPWFMHNGLFYLVRFTFLPFVTLTPMCLWFLQAMGMKLGKRVFINTCYISDPMFLTLGDDAVLGGSARIFAHYGGGGHLVIEPVEIGARATIGLGATVMGDVVVGDDATLLPHSVLLPGSRVGAGETWGGVPARKITREEFEQFKKGIRGLVELTDNGEDSED